MAPSLFGLENTNRKFSDPAAWGKNQFNSSFPTALACYMHSKKLDANYLAMDNGKIQVDQISIAELYGQDPLSNDVFFAFESTYVSLQPLIVGQLPRTDLVVTSKSNPSIQTRALEIKLTAIPDNTTADLHEDKYGSEIVVRPDSIFYLGAMIYLNNKTILPPIFNKKKCLVKDWTDPSDVKSNLDDIREVLRNISCASSSIQSPFLLQPIWKTLGKRSVLADNCLDLFVWSTLGFLDFIIDIGDSKTSANMTRPMRTVVWVYKVLEELVSHGQADFEKIVDASSFNTKNDKAFAASGAVTHKYMVCPNLVKPRILKTAIKDIVLGGGQHFLSPERRFDAILVNSPDIFR